MEGVPNSPIRRSSDHVNDRLAKIWIQCGGMREEALEPASRFSGNLGVSQVAQGGDQR
jgi:hypothetical protein